MKTIHTDNPLFIIGSPRSGTSLLRLILTNHSHILIPPECGFVIWLHQKYNNWHVSDNSNPNILGEYVQDLFECKKMDTWNITPEEVSQQIIFHQPNNYADLCSVIYIAYAKSINKNFSIWGDKNNFHINHLSELISIFTDARFLHIVRDGRDVACSYREVMATKSDSPYAPNLEVKIEDIATSWSSNVTKTSSFMEGIPKESAMTIRYEDLVTAPSHTIKSVCEWLGVFYEDGMLEFYQENIKKNLEPDLTLDWKKRTLQPISDNTVGRYQMLLSKREKVIFEDFAGNTLKKFNYITAVP